MARINVDDELFRDLRYQNLMIKLGDSTKALGTVVQAWMLAQKYWFPDKRPIPLNVFSQLPNYKELLDSKLASFVENGDFVYMHGSDAQFAWLFQKRSAGLESIRKKVQRRSTDVNVRQPLTPTLTPTLTHSLTHKENIYAHSDERASKFDFEILYKKYPRKLGKQRGIKICKVQIRSDEDYQALSRAIDRYVKYCGEKITDAQYIKHFSTFMSSWRDWLAEDVGEASNQVLPAWDINQLK